MYEPIIVRPDTISKTAGTSRIGYWMSEEVERSLAGMPAESLRAAIAAQLPAVYAELRQSCTRPITIADNPVITWDGNEWLVEGISGPGGIGYSIGLEIR